MTRSLPARYGRSPWVDQFPKARVPSYPAFRGEQAHDVVVVGGGLTGCVTAYAFAAAGIRVVLLEAAQLGRGATASTAGCIAVEPGVSFLALEKAIGLRKAKHAWQSWRRAALDFVALLRRLDVKCALGQSGDATVALTPEQANRLKSEHKARRDVGIETPFLSHRSVSSETALQAPAGFRLKEGATLDPYRACLGVAAAAAKRGVHVYERSAVKRITFTRKTVDIFTAAGSIRANTVVIATGMPTPLFKPLARHFWFHTEYLALTEPVPPKVRKAIRRPLVLRDGAEPPHLIRWVDDDRLLVSGADTQAGPVRLREPLLVQRTGQLMYELSTLYPDISGIQSAYGWDLPYARTEDGLPYLGPHRNFPHHLFAFGDDSRSITGAYLASRILLRTYLGELEAPDVPFEFARHGR